MRSTNRTTRHTLVAYAAVLLAPLAALRAVENPRSQDDFAQPLGKDSFWGLGGESGGHEGEKAGALEFRQLKIQSKP